MAPQTPVKILLIDDEASFVRGLARLLHRDGYTVHTADNGQHALAQLRTQCYDVILCDVYMPALDGPTLYALLRQQSPDLCQRMIFVTGDTLSVESTAFLAQCGQPCLYKPCTAAEVRRAIQQQLDRAASTGTEAPGAGDGSDPGGPLPEEGTLSIVWRGDAYHVRYASTNPYAPEYPARVCPDEATLRALLHALGTDAEALQDACAVARTGSMAILRLLVAPRQRQACFGPTAFQARGALAPRGNRHDAALPAG
jgi:CheY-like chemotaxis protein